MATILPNKKIEEDIVDRLGGIFSDSKLPEKYNGDLDDAIADEYHMKKYGDMDER